MIGSIFRLSAGGRSHLPAGGALLLTLLAGCTDPEITRMRYMEKAQSFADAGQHEKARVEYLNALRIEPNDADARFGAGAAFERLGSYQQAMGHFATAAELDPQHLDSRLAIGKLLIMARAAGEAETYVDQALALDSGNLDARALKASLVGLQGDMDTAEQLAAAVVQEAPDHLYAVPLLASRLVSTQRTDDALAVARRAVQLRPDAPGLRGVLAQVLWERDDVDGYLAELRQIAALEPDNQSHATTYARALARQGRAPEAAAFLRQRAVAEDAATEDRLSYLRFLAGAGDNSVVVEARELSERFPEEPELLLVLAQYHEQRSERQAAEALYTSLADSKVDKVAVAAKLALARDRFLSDDMTGAEALLAEVRADFPSEPDMLVLASELARARGDLTGAIGELRVALRDDPRNFELRRRLVQLYFSDGQQALGEQLLKESLEYPGAEAEPALQRIAAERALAQGRFDEALATARQLLRFEGNAPAVRELHYRAALAQSELDEALDSARTLSNLQPERGKGPFYEGMALQAQGDDTAAMAAYRLSLARQPGASEPLSALLRLLLQRDEHAAALDLLDQQQRLVASSPLIGKFRGDILADQGQWAEAIEVYRGVVAAHPQLPVTYQALARAQDRNGQRESGLITLQRGLNVTGHRPLVAELAMWQQSAGNVDAAIATYRDGLERFPADPMFANNLAMLLGEFLGDPGSLDEAIALVEPLEEENNPAYLDTLGWIHFKRGEFATAVRVLERAARLAPDSGLLRYHLGKARLSQGDTRGATEELERAVDSGNSFAGLEDAQQLLQRLRVNG